MPGEVRCAWCEAEGVDAHLRWQPELPTGTVSHGICKRHQTQILQEYEALAGHPAQRPRPANPSPRGGG